MRQVLVGLMMVASAAAALGFFVYRPPGPPDRLGRDALAAMTLDERTAAIANGVVEAGAPGAILLIRMDDDVAVTAAGVADKATGQAMSEAGAVIVGHINADYPAHLSVMLSNSIRAVRASGN